MISDGETTSCASEERAEQGQMNLICVCIFTAKPKVMINGSKGNTFFFFGFLFGSQLTEYVGFNNGTLSDWGYGHLSYL